MSDEDDDDDYGDDDEEGGGLDLGLFLGDEDPDDDDEWDEEESDLDPDEIKERAAIKRIRDSVNREEAREVFENTEAPDGDYTEEELDAFITKYVYLAYDDGDETVQWDAII